MCIKTGENIHFSCDVDGEHVSHADRANAHPIRLFEIAFRLTAYARRLFVPKGMNTKHCIMYHITADTLFVFDFRLFLFLCIRFASVPIFNVYLMRIVRKCVYLCISAPFKHSCNSLIVYLKCISLVNF